MYCTAMHRQHAQTVSLEIIQESDNSDIAHKFAYACVNDLFTCYY